MVAQRLRRAVDATAEEARRGFLAFWEEEGHRHFRIEEEILLPTVSRHMPPEHEAVVRVLVDHVDIRRRAADLAASHPSLASLHALGERLEAHMRHEERVLFPMIEAALDETELDDLLRAIARAEESG